MRTRQESSTLAEMLSLLLVPNHNFTSLRAILCKNQAKWEMKNFDLPSNFACN